MTWGIYLLALSVGIAVAAVSLRDPVAGLACWMAVFPLFSDVVVPGGFEKLAPTRLVHLAMLASLLLGASGARWQRLLRQRAIGLFGAFVAAGFASALLSGAPGESAGRALAYAEPGVWLAFGACCGLSAPWESDARMLLRGCAIGLLLVVALSVPELLQQRHYLVDAGLIRTDRDYMQDVRLGISGRIMSTIGQPVYAGIYALLGIAAAHLLLTLVRAGLLVRLAIVALIGLGIAFLVLSGSRAAIVALLLYPALFLMFTKDRRGIWKLMGLYAAVVAAAALLVPEQFLEFFGTSFAITRPTAASANVVGRLALTKRMFDIFAAHPLFGVGPGFIQKSVYERGAVSFMGLEGEENQYALLLAENGAIGFGLLVAFVGFVIWRATRGSGRHDGQRGSIFAGWLAAILACVILIAVSCSVLTTIPGYYLMGFIGGMLGWNADAASLPAQGPAAVGVSHLVARRA